MRAIYFALTALLIPSLSGASTSALTGTWISAPDEMPLSTAFDESVWGKNAKAVRTVQMSIQPTGDATLTITRKVLDARGRTVPASTSIEHASLLLGDVKSSNDVRSDQATTVKHAERRYPRRFESDLDDRRLASGDRDVRRDAGRDRSARRFSRRSRIVLGKAAPGRRQATAERSLKRGLRIHPPIMGAR